MKAKIIQFQVGAFGEIYLLFEDGLLVEAEMIDGNEIKKVKVINKFVFEDADSI